MHEPHHHQQLEDSFSYSRLTSHKDVMSDVDVDVMSDVDVEEKKNSMINTELKK